MAQPQPPGPTYVLPCYELTDKDLAKGLTAIFGRANWGKYIKKVLDDHWEYYAPRELTKLEQLDIRESAKKK